MKTSGFFLVLRCRVNPEVFFQPSQNPSVLTVVGWDVWAADISRRALRRHPCCTRTTTPSEAINGARRARRWHCVARNEPFTAHTPLSDPLGCWVLLVTAHPEPTGRPPPHICPARVAVCPVGNGQRRSGDFPEKPLLGVFPRPWLVRAIEVEGDARHYGEG